MTVQTIHPVLATAGGLRRVGGVDLFEGERITAVRADADALWVLASKRDLYRLDGDSPELVASLDDGVTGTCIGTHDGAVWIGGDPAALWRLRDGRFERVASFEAAPTHEDWHTPWGGPPAVFTMASDGTGLYVSVHVGGIMRSADGTSWTPTIDLHDDVHQVAVGPDGTVWAATGMRGLAESNDRGATWRYHTQGLHATYLLAVAVVDDAVLVGASSGHAGRDGAVYRFDGSQFARVSGLPDRLGGAVGPRQLAAAGDHAAIAVPDGAVFTSNDGGRTWTRLLDGVDDVREVILPRS
jgi:hypothetical protein